MENSLSVIVNKRSKFIQVISLLSPSPSLSLSHIRDSCLLVIPKASWGSINIMTDSFNLSVAFNLLCQKKSLEMRRNQLTTLYVTSNNNVVRFLTDSLLLLTKRQLELQVTFKHDRLLSNCK